MRRQAQTRNPDMVCVATGAEHFGIPGSRPPDGARAPE